MAIPRIESHWRDSGRIPRFFTIDARAAFPFLFCLLHMRLWTIILAFCFTLFFGLIEHYGFSTVVFLRTIRTILSGKIKMTRPWWREDRFR